MAENKQITMKKKKKKKGTEKKKRKSTLLALKRGIHITAYFRHHCWDLLMKRAYCPKMARIHHKRGKNYGINMDAIVHREHLAH